MCLDDRWLGRNRTFLKRLLPEVAQQAKYSGFSWPQLPHHWLMPTKVRYCAICWEHVGRKKLKTDNHVLYMLKNTPLLSYFLEKIHRWLSFITGNALLTISLSWMTINYTCSIKGYQLNNNHRKIPDSLHNSLKKQNKHVWLLRLKKKTHGKYWPIKVNHSLKWWHRMQSGFVLRQCKHGGRQWQRSGDLSVF